MLGRGTSVCRRTVLLVAAIVLMGVACTNADPLGQLVAADQPSRIAIIRDGTDVVIHEDSVSWVVWALDPGSLNGSVIESLEPVDARRVLVGVCCEVADGRQLIVDLAGGPVEILPLPVRFPSVSQDGNLVWSGGSEVVADNLGQFLAYESGVGVVERGPTVRVAPDGFALRPLGLPGDRVALVEPGLDGSSSLVIVDREGSVEVSASVGSVVSTDYDPENNVIVALMASRDGTASDNIGGDTIVVFSTQTLEQLAAWNLDDPAVAIDTGNGWILSTRADGSVASSPMSSPSEVTVIDGAGATAASWLR